MPVQAELINSGTIQELVARYKQELNPRDANRATRRGLREGINLVAEEIRRTTPVETGRLRDSTFARTRTIQGAPIGEAGWRDLQPKMLVIEFGGFANVGLPSATGLFREGKFIITDAWNRTFPQAASLFGTTVEAAMERISNQTAENAARAVKRNARNLRRVQARQTQRSQGAR